MPSCNTYHLLGFLLPFSYLGFLLPWVSLSLTLVSLHGCSSKVQLLLLTLDNGYLLTATPPELECGVAPLGPPAPAQPPLLGRGVAPLRSHPWPPVVGGHSSQLLPLTSGMG